VRINSSDRFVHHKTTRRELFDAEFARAQEQGHGEILFLNERGELTEGSRTNLFVERNGEFLTPPLASGVLPGCLRAELIARQSSPVTERILTPDDLRTSDAIYVGNSLRGVMRARLIG
jgi:para-aminobenzoate synthetase/4-amino-4-deoxychorismate lyase